jgi:UDP-N-acetylglucosamine 4,6-dehydratase
MVNNSFKGKIVLVTGGTGSFGQAFVKKLLEEDACKQVIVFSRDEFKQGEMRRAHKIFNSSKIHYVLGDVRELSPLQSACQGVDIVVHSAALKQVPAAERNPSEFVKTNVQGTMNVIEAAIAAQVEKVIAISSDKAVSPINLYGATKLCVEKLIIAANQNASSERGRQTQLSIVRYGNVLDSRGSIVPLWRGLIAEGAKTLPLTDPNMTRFFMTIDDAVMFVRRAVERMEGQEIFVAKCASMKVCDLAQALAPDLQLEISGIRPGEKLHEVLINSDESRNGYAYSDYYVILPEGWKETPGRLEQFLKRNPGRSLKSGFSYSSDRNDHWLTSGQLLERLSGQYFSSFSPVSQ